MVSLHYNVTKLTHDLSCPDDANAAPEHTHRRLTAEHNSPMPANNSAHHNLLTTRALHTAHARTGTTSSPVPDSLLAPASRQAWTHSMAERHEFHSTFCFVLSRKLMGVLRRSGPVPEHE
jgi:hypothetical protein